MGHTPIENKIDAPPATDSDSKIEYKRVRGVIDGVKHDDIVSFLNDLLEEGRDYRDVHPIYGEYGFADRMVEYQAMYTGLHDLISDFGITHLNLSNALEFYTIQNFAFEKIEVTSAIVGGGHPTWRYKAPTPETVGVADKITGGFEKYNDQKMGTSAKNYQIAKSQCNFGHCIAHLYHDFTLCEPYGKEACDILDPLSLFFAPETTRWESAKYRGVTKVENIHKVVRQWRAMKRNLEIKGRTPLPPPGIDSEEAQHWNLSYAHGVNKNYGDSKMDNALVHYMEYDDMTEEKKTEKGYRARKYPNGRFFVWSNNTIIYDGPNPYNHGDSQFFYIRGHLVDGFLFGESLCEVIWDIQKGINESETLYRYNTCALGNPPGAYYPDAFVNEEPTFKPGDYEPMKKLIPKGQAINTLQLGDVTGQAQKHKADTIYAADIISGVRDAVRGEARSGDSGIKVELLDEKATRRLAPLTKFLVDDFLEPYGWRLMSNLVQFENPDEYLDISDDRSDQADLINLNEELQRFKDPRIASNLQLVVGSNMPNQREYKAQRAMEIAQYVPDVPAWIILTLTDVPELVNYGQELKEHWMLEAQNQEALQQMLPQLQQLAEAWKSTEKHAEAGEMLGNLLADMVEQFEAQQTAVQP